MPIQPKCAGARFLTAAALGLALLAPSGSLAEETVEAESGVEIGTLSCESVPGSGLNLIVHSTVDIKCTFTGTDGSVEHYKGETGVGLGIDLSFGHEETFHFAVLAAKFDSDGHHLSGSYAGGKASVSLGIGGGGKVLIGGDHDNIGLKPAVIQSGGVGVAAGLTYMHLEPDLQ